MFDVYIFKYSNMKKLFYGIVLLSTLQATAQKIPNPKPFAKEISLENLKTNLYAVAGDEMKGRETATEGQRLAATYIENQFKTLGLLPGASGSYQMHFPVYQDSLLQLALSVNEQGFEAGKDFSINIANASNFSYKFSEIVFAGFGINNAGRNDYSSVDVKGKLVVVLSANFAEKLDANDRKSLNAFTQQEAAQKNGAAAILIIDRKVDGVSSKSNMYVNTYRSSMRINSFVITEAVASAIFKSEYASIKNLDAATFKSTTLSSRVALEIAKKPLQLQGTNVLGLLEGSDLKDEYVVLTAHYDHLGERNGTIWYGADDDGSGTVAILELAKVFSKARAGGKGPRRSILFMTVSGEEKGLWGSDYYGSNPAFPLNKTTVNLNIDMIGRIDPSRKRGDSTNYVYVVGDDKLSSDLKPISEQVNKKYVKMELDYRYNDPKDPERIYYRSDHYNFAKHGVPIIFYFNGLHADYHKPSDTPDKINYPLLQKRTTLVFYTAWEMANRNAMLKRDIPLN